MRRPVERWVPVTLMISMLAIFTDTKKKDMISGLPLWMSDDLEFWPEREGTQKFLQIACLHSEFIAISSKGELHQWRWADNEPYKNVEVGSREFSRSSISQFSCSFY
jgi:hypothetical protein